MHISSTSHSSDNLLAERIYVLLITTNWHSLAGIHH
jgi:hypothetical protein